MPAILDRPEAVNDTLRSLYGDNSFLTSPHYLGAAKRYGQSVERAGGPTSVSGGACFVTSGPCLVDSSNISGCGGG